MIDIKRFAVYFLALVMLVGACLPFVHAEEAIVSVDNIAVQEEAAQDEAVEEEVVSEPVDALVEEEEIELVAEEEELEGLEPAMADSVVVSDVTVTGTLQTDKTITAKATVTGGSGAYAYNYWLFNDQGVIVMEKTNTYDTSWEFTAPAAGVYLMRIYATDFATDSHADSAWFAVEGEKLNVSNVTVTGDLITGKKATAKATVTGGSGTYAYNYWLFNDQGVIVMEKTNTFDTSWELTLPDPGVYLMRIYATDFTTDGHADSAWFMVENEKLIVSDVKVEGDLKTSKKVVAKATVTGNAGPCAYNYWLFNDQGVIVMEHTNTFDTSWEFEAPAAGVYLMRIYATDFATDNHADSAWFLVEEEAFEVGDEFVEDEVTYKVIEGGVKVKSYSGSAASLVIPEAPRGYTVLEVGESAFENNKTLASIDLPDTVELIGKRAFAGCSKLTTMN